MSNSKLIAVAVESEKGMQSTVSHHFGRCPSFVLVRTVNRLIESYSAVKNPHYTNHQPGMVPAFIREQNADVILAGGMGPRAVNIFTANGIEVATGAVGSLKAVVQAYLDGEIKGVVPCAHNHEDSCGSH